MKSFISSFFAILAILICCSVGAMAVRPVETFTLEVKTARVLQDWKTRDYVDRAEDMSK